MRFAFVFQQNDGDLEGLAVGTVLIGTEDGNTDAVTGLIIEQGVGKGIQIRRFHTVQRLSLIHI